jgi:hypothetical protein
MNNNKPAVIMLIFILHVCNICSPFDLCLHVLITYRCFILHWFSTPLYTFEHYVTFSLLTLWPVASRAIK